MALPHLKPNFLLIQELNYELRIRGVESSRDVNDKRKILSRLLVKERGRDILLTDPLFNFKTEEVAITNT